MSLWTQDETQLLVENYETHGAEYCAELIPDKSPTAIIQRAARLRLRSSRNRIYNNAVKTGRRPIPRDDLTGIPVHAYTEADHAARAWSRYADAQPAQLRAVLS